MTDADALSEFTRRRNLVEADLLRLAQRHEPEVGALVVVHAAIELAGVLAATVIEAEPEARTGLVAQIDALRLYVAAAGQRPQ